MSKSSKRIVITGVSRGLGLAMVEGFIARGHVVQGCARSPETVSRLQGKHGPPHGFAVVDVGHDDEVARWARQVLAEAAPDLLLNNAALMNRAAPLWQVPADEFLRILAVNIAGTASTIRHFLPAMIQRGRGVVVNFSSGWGRGTSPQVAPYCATKWAIEGLTKALAEELPRGLAAVSLNPGIINTEMLHMCWGSDADACIDPETWAKTAVPFLLKLGPSDNGAELTVPSEAEE